MYLQSTKSVKHNAAMSVNRSILKKSRHSGIGLLYSLIPLRVFLQNEALVNQFPVGNHAGLNRQEAEARLLEDFNQLVTIMLREESIVVA
jgi:hypothetical protein